MDEDDEFIRKKAHERIENAHRLVKEALGLKDAYGAELNGCKKLARRIQAEISFLEKKLSSGKSLKMSHITSSNLSHLTAVIEAAKSFSGVIKLFQVFVIKSLPPPTNQIQVDLIANEGRMWVKVIARKPDALLNMWNGECEYKNRTLEDQIEIVRELCEENPVNYTPPTFAIYAANGMHQSMAEEIEEMDVLVLGTVIGENGENDLRTPAAESMQISTIYSTINPTYLHSATTVNLDVTSALTLLSNVTHGKCGYKFLTDVLSEQAAEERSAPGELWKDLCKFLDGKKIIICQTALNDFEKILHTVGGPSEKKRAEVLMKRVTAVEDQSTERIANLTRSAVIKRRSIAIFGCGDYHQAVTLTANYGFVRALSQQNIRLDVYRHSARALTEQKESGATLVAPESQRDCNCYLCFPES